MTYVWLCIVATLCIVSHHKLVFHVMISSHVYQLQNLDYFRTELVIRWLTSSAVCTKTVHSISVTPSYSLHHTICKRGSSHYSTATDTESAWIHTAKEVKVVIILGVRDVGCAAAEIVAQLEFLFDDVQHYKVATFWSLLVRVHENTFAHRDEVTTTLFQYVSINVNMNANLYCALWHAASNELGAPSTDKKASFSTGDRSWWCWDLDRVDRCSVCFKPLSQRHLRISIYSAS